MPQTGGAMCKGALFIVNAGYIKKIVGDDGLQKVVSKVKAKWPQFDIGSIKEKDWLPLDIRVAFLEACKSELSWDDKRLYLMGSDAAQHSSILKSFIMYFLNINKALSYAPELWGNNYNTGKLTLLQNEKKSGKLALTDFRHSPILCAYLAGYFHGVGSVVAKKANVQVTEEKCVHKGAERCEFSFTWSE